VTPLDELARLLAKYGHEPQAITMASLAAREEMRVEGEAFWADLAGPAVFGPSDSIASLELGASAPPGDSLERDRAAFRRALRLVAEELRLRAFANADSERWRTRLAAR
jgi:hypothetical protein